MKGEIGRITISLAGKHVQKIRDYVQQVSSVINSMEGMTPE